MYEDFDTKRALCVEPITSMNYSNKAEGRTDIFTRDPYTIFLDVSDIFRH